MQSGVLNQTAIKPKLSIVHTFHFYLFQVKTLATLFLSSCCLCYSGKDRHWLLSISQPEPQHRIDTPKPPPYLSFDTVERASHAQDNPSCFELLSLFAQPPS